MRRSDSFSSEMPPVFDHDKGAHCEDEPGKGDPEMLNLKALCERTAGEHSDQGGGQKHAGQAPVERGLPQMPDQPSKGVDRDDDERSDHGRAQRKVRKEKQRRHDEESAPDAEKASQQADRETGGQTT